MKSLNLSSINPNFTQIVKATSKTLIIAIERKWNQILTLILDGCSWFGLDWLQWLQKRRRDRVHLLLIDRNLSVADHTHRLHLCPYRVLHTALHFCKACLCWIEKEKESVLIWINDRLSPPFFAFNFCFFIFSLSFHKVRAECAVRRQCFMGRRHVDTLHNPDRSSPLHNSACAIQQGLKHNNGFNVTGFPILFIHGLISSGIWPRYMGW